MKKLEEIMTKEEREKRIEELRKELFILEHTCNCENCGKVIPEISKFCPEYGALVQSESVRSS